MEQNTDRMYWTVGIIVLGALVIAAAAVLFPELANKVGGTITKALEAAPKPPVIPGASG